MVGVGCNGSGLERRSVTFHLFVTLQLCVYSSAVHAFTRSSIVCAVDCYGTVAANGDRAPFVFEFDRNRVPSTNQVFEYG